MGGISEFVDRAVMATGARTPHVAAAFATLFRTSWPKPAVIEAVHAATREHAYRNACERLLLAFDAAHAAYPTACFWWKDETSHFLGFCPRLAAAAGLGQFDLLGRTDGDPDVVWSRQGALYMKDDREVLLSGQPKFDIVERQDREGGTVWLRTSKVPYASPAGSGTVGGFDMISAAHARELAKARNT